MHIIYICEKYDYISLYRAFYFCLQFLSFFFSREDRMPTDVAESGGRRPSGVFLFLFLSLFARNKRKIPSSPRPPHIFNTRFVLHFFFSFFPFFFCYYYTRTHGRVAESLTTRARVFYDSNYAFFFPFFSRTLSLLFSISRYSLIIIIIIRLDCWYYRFAPSLIRVSQAYDRSRRSDLFFLISRALRSIHKSSLYRRARQIAMKKTIGMRIRRKHRQSFSRFLRLSLHDLITSFFFVILKSFQRRRHFLQFVPPRLNQSLILHLLVPKGFDYSVSNIFQSLAAFQSLRCFDNDRLKV